MLNNHNKIKLTESFNVQIIPMNIRVVVHSLNIIVHIL